MSDTILIVLPGPPKGKGRPRFSDRRGSRPYTPASTRSYEREGAWMATTAMRGKKLLTGPLKAVVRVYYPVARSWSQAQQIEAIAGSVNHKIVTDIDNFCKAAFDFCNHIVYEDDKQITHAEIFKSYSEDPRLEIEISQIPERILTQAEQAEVAAIVRKIRRVVT